MYKRQLRLTKAVERACEKIEGGKERERPYCRRDSGFRLGVLVRKIACSSYSFEKAENSAVSVLKISALLLSVRMEGGRRRGGMSWEERRLGE